MKNGFYIILLALLVCAGCQQKELLEKADVESDVSVKFDWTAAPGASPSKMTLYLFPEQGGQPQRYGFDNADGGKIVVPVGTYDALAVNGDTHAVLYRNTDRFATYEAYTDEVKIIDGLNIESSAVPRAEGTEKERMAAQADKLWRGTAANKLVLKPRGGSATLTLPMSQVSETYNITVRNVGNLDDTAKNRFGASISTLAGAVRLADGSFGDESVTIPTALKADAAKRTLTGRAVSLGNCANGAKRHFMMVYVILSDGQKYGYKYDVSAQIHNATDRSNIPIVIDGLDLPKPIGKEGGLKPEVGEWKIIEVPIDIK